MSTKASAPSWLPETITLSHLGNDDDLRKLSSVFDRDFIVGRPHFLGCPVWWNRKKKDGCPYEEGFWHLITKGAVGKRYFDPPRAERLPWCAPILVNSPDSELKIWRYREGGKQVRTYVWLEQWDYIAILAERKHSGGTVMFLVTAFYIDGKSTIRNLKRKFLSRLA